MATPMTSPAPPTTAPITFPVPALTPPPIPADPVVNAPATTAAEAVQPIIVQVPAQEGGVDWFELVIAVIGLLGALSLPLAVCLVVWWLREPIKAKINAATTVEAFGIKLLLADVVVKARAIRGEADIHENADSVAASGTHRLEAENLTSGAAILDKPEINATPPSFERIAAIDARSAILGLWTKIEERLNELAAVHDLPVNSRNMHAVIEFLDASNVVPIYLSSIIQDLKRVRNAAAHSSDARLGLKEALTFQDAAQILLSELDDLINSGMAQRHENRSGM